MTRRRVLLGLLLASAVLACCAGLWIVSRPRSMRARFEQVKEGMTREEVIRTVGAPPGHDSNSGYRETPPDVRFEHDLEEWSCDDGLLMVRFDDRGTAAEVYVLDIGVGRQTLTERIRRWLGL
jgi:hypothetical protein